MEEHIIRMSSLYDDENFAADGPKAVCCDNMEETRCYCSEESYAALRERLSGVPLRALHHIDTGDFHYLSALFIERIREPFELCFFDNHPDTQPLAFEAPGMVSCGSWRSFAQKSSYMETVRTFGIGGTRGSILERLRGKTPENQLPVYLSIDLDVLSKEEFTANWNQGTMSFDELAELIRECTAGRRILGADICGGTTLIQGASAHVLTGNKKLRSRLSAFLEGLMDGLQSYC